ncbi:MAG: nuclear transport factor 2 family protein [Planctomycetes bacterium]|nr:nuclear transport factor 2 family protein [Planctomycetota bacterium]
MIKATLALACAAAVTVTGLSAAPRQDKPELPAGHPPPRPAIPSGHPPVREPATTQPGEASAKSEDVQSVDAIVAAYYDSVSGPAGEARDWDRFRSLFWTEAKLVSVNVVGGRAIPMVLTPDGFARTNRAYFERGGYFESEVHREVNAFGNIAQAFSTYESRRSAEDPKPYSRGINSFQLLKADGRWWIVTVTWDHERGGKNPLPPEFLPAAGG